MRTLFLTIALLFVANGLFSQTNYYTETKTFYEDGYTYQVDVPFLSDVELYNKDNKWIYVDARYKETGMSANEAIEMYDADFLDEAAWHIARSVLHSIIIETFPENVRDMSKVSDYNFFVLLYINSETGIVDEVSFSFSARSPFAYAPVSVYRRMELDIKNKVRFTVTEEGKKLNYIFYWDYYKFK